MHLDQDENAEEKNIHITCTSIMRLATVYEMSFCHEETPMRIAVMSSSNETDQLGNTELKDRDDIPLLLEGKK